jgi:hypothetical protein
VGGKTGERIKEKGETAGLAENFLREDARAGFYVVQ